MLVYMTSTQNPRPEYASPGAVNQKGGLLPIRRCQTCGDDIVFCKSARTGKSYPVSVSRGYVGQRFYIGANVHRCEATLARRAENEAHETAMIEAKAQVDTLKDMQAKLRAGEITRDDMIAWVEAGMPAEGAKL